MNIIMLFDRVKNKIKRPYRSYIFRKTVNCPHKNFKLVGDITVINRNIQVGQNVCIYPGCMFFGDGPIIGAKALVKGEITENAIAVGIPAKEIKKRP